MIEICGPTILNAVDSGEIECFRDDGQLTLVAESKPVLKFRESPLLQIHKRADDSVTILNDDGAVARIQLDNADEAKYIASKLAEILMSDD